MKRTNLHFQRPSSRCLWNLGESKATQINLRHVKIRPQLNQQLHRKHPQPAASSMFKTDDQQDSRLTSKSKEHKSWAALDALPPLPPSCWAPSEATCKGVAPWPLRGSTWDFLRTTQSTSRSSRWSRLSNRLTPSKSSEPLEGLPKTTAPLKTFNSTFYIVYQSIIVYLPEPNGLSMPNSCSLVAW